MTCSELACGLSLLTRREPDTLTSMPLLLPARGDWPDGGEGTSLPSVSRTALGSAPPSSRAHQDRSVQASDSSEVPQTGGLFQSKQHLKQNPPHLSHGPITEASLGMLPERGGILQAPREPMLMEVDPPQPLLSPVLPS